MVVVAGAAMAMPPPKSRVELPAAPPDRGASTVGEADNSPDPHLCRPFTRLAGGDLFLRFPGAHLHESAVLADALGLASIGGDSSQKVSPEIDRNLDFHLSPEQMAAVKARLRVAAKDGRLSGR